MRFEDWDVRLAECVSSAQERPFEWGQHDCTLWAMSVRSALTGAAPAPWQGKYKTPKGAARKMLRMGAQSLEEAGRIVLGEPINPRLAQRGDIVLTPNDDPEWPEVFGVCIGSEVAVVTPEGLSTHSLLAARLAWRI